MPTLADYSVKFGRDPVMGLEGKNVFPYFYSLVNHNDIDWTQGATPPDVSTYAVLCKAGAVTPHYVRLDPDYNYKLIAIKYAAFYNNAGVYEQYSAFNAAYLYLPDVLPGNRYTHNIQVTLSVQGSGSQTIFGGQQAGYNMNGAAKVPLAVDCMQGYEYGFQALRCEYLAPMQAVLSFEFTNTHATRDLYVAAMMYGFKIRL